MATATPDLVIDTVDTVFVNARLLDPATGLDAPGGVAVRDGLITAVGPEVVAAESGAVKVVDCHGQCLAPGLIDSRVHMRIQGDEHMGGAGSTGAAAAAGGVTSVLCLPDTSPPIDELSLVESVVQHNDDEGVIRVYPYAAVTRGLEGAEMAEMMMLAEAGAVAFTDAGRAVADALVMRRALTYAATFDLLVVQHPEEPSLAEGGDMNEGETATLLGLRGIPDAAEAIMLERDMRLVALTDARYHAAHISTAAAVDIIRRAKADGLAVTCDTAPPYFTLNDTAVGDYRTFAKLSPPLRDEADRAAIAAAVADGTIDVVASDHDPHDQDAKRLPFTHALPGIVGLETLLALTLNLYHNGGAGLLDALARLTCRPAEIFRLPAGKLAIGAPADLVLFDPDKPWKIDPDAFVSKTKNSPYEDFPVQGQVLRTVLAGRTVYDRDG